MSNVHLAVPDLFLPQHMAAEASAGLALPALGVLLGRAQPEPLPEESLEAWLCNAFGLAEPAIAPLTLRADGQEPGAYYWLRADPVHLSLQRDQLILYPDVPAAEGEAVLLCASLNAHFSGHGMKFSAPHPQRWYLQLDDVPDMNTTSLAQVEGGNVYEHLPQGADALRWHGVFNEIQMLLYDHPVNQAREARGELPINSLWFWGGGNAGAELLRPCARMCSDSSLALAFAHAAGVACEPLPGDAAQRIAEGGLVVVWDGLRRAYRRGDLLAWREELQRLEQCCIRPLLDALRGGRIAWITLDTLQAGASRRFVLTRGAAWKLWRRPGTLADYAVPDN